MRAPGLFLSRVPSSFVPLVPGLEYEALQIVEARVSSAVTDEMKQGFAMAIATRLSLTTRTVVGTAATLDDPTNGPTASLAGLALSIIGHQRNLKQTTPATPVGKVVEGRATLSDCLTERLPNRVRQPLPARR